MAGWDSDPKQWGHYEDDDDNPSPVARRDPKPEENEPRAGGESGSAPLLQPIDLETEVRYLSQPAPNEGQATDYTSSVTLHIDTDRRPLRLLLKENWRERVPPQTLGNIIMQLYSKALADQRAKAADYLRKHRGDANTAPAGAPQEDEGPPRSDASFFDSFYTALEKFESLKKESPKNTLVDSQSAPEPQTFSFIFNGNYLTACAVNANWAQRSAASAIMTEFSRALREAGERHGAEPEPESEAQKFSREMMKVSKELMGIGNEAISRLRWMTRN